MRGIKLLSIILLFTSVQCTKEVKEIAKKHNLVPNTHQDDPNWYKIVVMDHVSNDMIHNFIKDLKLTKPG